MAHASTSVPHGPSGPHPFGRCCNILPMAPTCSCPCHYDAVPEPVSNVFLQGLAKGPAVIAETCINCGKPRDYTFDGVLQSICEACTDSNVRLRTDRNEPYAYRSASGDIIAADRTKDRKARDAAHSALDLFIDANIDAQHSGGMREAEWAEKMRAIGIARHRLEDAMNEAWRPPTTADPCDDCGASRAFCEFNQQRKRGYCCVGCTHLEVKP